MLSKQTLMTISPCWFLLRGCRCVCVFACRWLPGRVHHAVEHRCAGCGGLCQPQVCLQSAFQLGLYIGITVSVWPCVSQPLCFLKLGFILESLCVSLTCVSQPLCFLKLGFILESLCVSLTCVSQPLCFLKLGFILESLCVSLTVCHCQSASLLSEIGLYIGITVSIWPCVSQPLCFLKLGFILESLCVSLTVCQSASQSQLGLYIRITVSVWPCVQALFGRCLLHLSVFCSQTQSGGAWKVMPTNWVILLENSTVLLCILKYMVCAWM